MPVPDFQTLIVRPRFARLITLTIAAVLPFSSIGAQAPRADALRLGVSLEQTHAMQSASPPADRGVTRGTVIGGTAGLLLGAAVGGAIGGGFCDAADCRDVTREGIIGGAIIGALTGAALGAALAYFF